MILQHILFVFLKSEDLTIIMHEKANQSTKKPWPTQAAMTQVYDKKLWGGIKTHFYSGEGSHHPELVVPYVNALQSFLTTFDTPVTVCDLGCGDFNVGKQLAPLSQKYIAIDIVPKLIAHNVNIFASPTIEFTCLDIAVDPLPKADCAIIRQVLQHISNAEILSICKKLDQFKYVIVTEHLPEGDFIPNVDIISGQGIRLKKQSGVNLLAAPFNLTIKEEKKLLSTPVSTGKGVITTNLYTMF